MYEINENTEKLKGMQIKMTTTHGASSMSGPMCIAISGLDETELIMSDEELKNRRGIFVLKVQGFTVAGYANPLDTGYGYVIFMQSSKGKKFSADETRVEHYRQNVRI